MDEYYSLRYKSYPEKASYVLCKKGSVLEILNSSISAKSMGIKLDENGSILIPKYFFPLKRMDRLEALKIISEKRGEKIEKVINSI